MTVEELYQKLKLLKRKNSREIYIISGESNLIYSIEDVFEARHCQQDDGVIESIDSADIPRDSLIIKV